MMILKKIIAETVELNGDGKKLMKGLQKELLYLKELPATKLKKYEIIDSELETVFLKSKPFNYLVEMKKNPQHKNGINRYFHTLDFFKGVLALVIGEKAEELFVRFDPELAAKGKKPITSKQYKAIVKNSELFLQDEELLLFLTVIILMHESGHTDIWDQRHFSRSASNAALSVAEMGFDKSWYELARFLIDGFVYFRELLSGEANLKYQEEFASVSLDVLPERYRDINKLTFLCKLLTLLDINASGRIFLTTQRLDYITLLELTDRNNFNELYLKKRTTILREDLADLAVAGYENIYFRYFHTIVNAKDDEGVYLFSREQLKNMMVAIVKLEKTAREQENLDFKYLILEEMSTDALRELKERLFDVSKHVPDIEISNSGTIYFLNYPINFEGDYLIINNR